MRSLVLIIVCTTTPVLSACSGNDAPETDALPPASTQPAAPASGSDVVAAQGGRVDWDTVLAGLTGDARDDALDLVTAAKEKRLKVAEWLGEAIEKENQARQYQAAGEDERARRAREQAAEKRRSAKEKIIEARADEARALALASGDARDAGEHTAGTIGAGQFGVEKFKAVYAMEGQRNGTRTVYVEDYGARVGVEEDLVTYGQRTQTRYYWDGEQSYLQDSKDGAVVSSRLRTKASEPTAFATTGAQQLAAVGYRRIGSRTVAGQSCEHWKHEQLNFEGCRNNGIEFEFANGAGTAKIIQSARVTEFVPGEGIPEHLTALAQ